MRLSAVIFDGRSPQDPHCLEIVAFSTFNAAEGEIIRVFRFFKMAVPIVSSCRLWTSTSSLSYIRPAYDISRRIVPQTQLRLSSSSSSSSSSSPSPKWQSSPSSKFKPTSRLHGRTCMVTGGTSGIGFAIAERFLQEEATTIILVGRSQERLQKAAEKLSLATNTETTSEKVRLLVGDVGEAGGWMRELEREMVRSRVSWVINKRTSQAHSL